jgi:hypothetical protein
MNSKGGESMDTKDLASRKDTSLQRVKGDGVMKISLEASYASVGEGDEQLGRTYLRIHEVGTFTQDTSYSFIRDKINETLRVEQLRDEKALEIIERGVERRKQIQR